MSQFSELKWRCRRGIKELDLTLCFYIETYYKKANKEDRNTFKQLLALEDPILYDLLLGNIEPTNDEQKGLLIKLRKCGNIAGATAMSFNESRPNEQ